MVIYIIELFLLLSLSLQSFKSNAYIGQIGQWTHSQIYHYLLLIIISINFIFEVLALI